MGICSLAGPPLARNTHTDIKQEFKVAPKDKVAPVGSTATFDCLPQAWPEPKIQWRHNGRLIDPDEFRLADGSGKYWIERIAKADLNITGASGPSGGQAAARATTTNNSNNNNDQDQYVDVFGSRLVIKQVDKNDEGKYSCLVETKGSHRLIERESASGQLTVSGKLAWRRIAGVWRQQGAIGN